MLFKDKQNKILIPKNRSVIDLNSEIWMYQQTEI